MKSKLINLLLVLIFVAGLSLLLYPTVSDAYNSYLQSKIIVQYASQVSQMENQAYEQELSAARSYNAALAERKTPFSLSPELEEQYWNLLNSTEIMAYVEIPSIEVTLPIAHGTEKDTLEDFVGHIKWSSLPVGGESTHCAISGHRGLPSSELFTNLDHLDYGDTFYIHVLGQTLEYWVDHIAVVLPDDMELLKITEGEDYVTLITCTPYGINSHRLLVRGTRIDRSGTVENPTLYLKNEAEPLDLMMVIPAVLVAVSVLVFILLALKPGKKKREKKGNE